MTDAFQTKYVNFQFIYITYCIPLTDAFLTLKDATRNVDLKTKEK